MAGCRQCGRPGTIKQGYVTRWEVLGKGAIKNVFSLGLPDACDSNPAVRVGVRVGLGQHPEHFVLNVSIIMGVASSDKFVVVVQ